MPLLRPVGLSLLFFLLACPWHAWSAPAATILYTANTWGHYRTTKA